MMVKLSPIKDVLVVVRSVGERTEAVTKSILESQVEPGRVIVVSDQPFTKTLFRSFEVALDMGLPWTVCVDADVVPFADSVTYLHRVAYVLPEHVFGVQGFVLDKLFGLMRPAGIRLYRTALLKEAMKIAVDPASKRPETYVVKRMKEKGWRWMQQGVLGGVHDFEQYYVDYYRKGFFHAQKHLHYLPWLTQYWKRMQDTDFGYKMALWGAEEGRQSSNALGLDARNFTNRSNEILDKLGVAEKLPLMAQGKGILMAEKILRYHRMTQEVKDLEREIQKERSGWQKGKSLVLKRLRRL